MATSLEVPPRVRQLATELAQPQPRRRGSLSERHIPAEHAEAVQKFYTAEFNPYLNFHRPCGFATVSLDSRGKRRRQYKREDYATPYEN